MPDNTDTTVVDFTRTAGKHRHQRLNDEKDAKAEAMRQRFAAVLPDKPRPVKDYLNKKAGEEKTLTLPGHAVWIFGASDFCQSQRGVV